MNFKGRRSPQLTPTTCQFSKAKESFTAALEKQETDKPSFFCVFGCFFFVCVFFSLMDVAISFLPHPNTHRAAMSSRRENDRKGALGR